MSHILKVFKGLLVFLSIVCVSEDKSRTRLEHVSQLDFTMLNILKVLCFIFLVHIKITTQCFQTQ